MIKLKSLIENIENKLYHVTKKSNLSSIRKNGIRPSALSPVDIGDRPSIFLFKDRNEMEDSVVNWMETKFDENEPLVCLTINPNGLKIYPSSVEWEVLCFDVIPWNHIIKVEDL